MNTVLILTTTILLSVNPKAPVDQSSSLNPEKYSARFKALPLAAGPKSLTTYLGKITATQYKTRMDQTVNDPHAYDRIQAEIALRMQAIRDSLIHFKGQNTGYNVSVVNDEFAHNSGESMMVMPILKAHDYFFFVKGRGLWKVVTTSVSRQRFAVFLLGLTQIYGAATTVEYADPDTRETPIRATWDNGKLRLEARTRPDYGAITVSWALAQVSDQISKLRGSNKPPAAGISDELDPAILDIMRD